MACPKVVKRMARGVLWGIIVGPPTILICICAGIATGHIEFFSFHAEYRDLTFEQYLAKSGEQGLFDFHAAKQISMKHAGSIDGFDTFFMLTIGAPAYENLVERTTEKMRNAQDRAGAAKARGNVRKFVGESAILPAYWPDPDEAPDWWAHTERGPLVELTRWELQCEGRAKGWLLEYNRSDSRLFVWEWNHQHARLPDDQDDSTDL